MIIMDRQNRDSSVTNGQAKPSKFSSKAIFELGQAVNVSIVRFANICESLAQGNSEVKTEMFDACKAARSVGSILEQLCGAKTNQEIKQMNAYTEKCSITRCSRSLLSSITRILTISDSILVKQILSSKERISITNSKLESVANFTEFVKSFAAFGDSMIELTYTLTNRKNHQKEELTKAEIDSARRILQKSTVVLLTASKTCLRHPDCDIAKENRDKVFFQIQNAMNIIYSVIREEVTSSINKEGANLDNFNIRQSKRSAQMIKYDPPSNRIHWNSKSGDLTALDAIHNFKSIVKMGRLRFDERVYHEHLLSSFSALIERTQDFTDSAYTKHEHREKILILADQAKHQLNQLIRFDSCIDDIELNYANDDIETWILKTLRTTNDIKNQLRLTAVDQMNEVFKFTVENEIINPLRKFASAGNQERLDEYAERFIEHCDHLQEVCRLLYHVTTTQTLQVSSKATETCITTFGYQVINACNTLCVYSNSKIAKENLDAFFEYWMSLYDDLHSITNGIQPNYLNCDKVKPHSLTKSMPNRLIKYQNINSNQSLSLSSSNESGYIKSLETKEEQTNDKKAGVEKTTLASELDALLQKYSQSEDSEIIRKTKAMLEMFELIYKFTRGEGDLRTTQDLFTQAEFFAEKANKFYKLVRHLSYQIPSGEHKTELLEHLDKVPIFVQQLQFTVKNPTVGKAATFTKVDNVIKETENLMKYVNTTVKSCLACSIKYNVDMELARMRLQNMSPSGRYIEDDNVFENTLSSSLSTKTTPAPSQPESDV